MNKLKIIASAFIAILSSASAWAGSGNNDGFYIVGSAGRSDISVAASTITGCTQVEAGLFDCTFRNFNNGFSSNVYTFSNTHDTGYEGQIGYRWGNFALEGGYADLGKVSFTDSLIFDGAPFKVIDGTLHVTAINLDAVSYIPLSQHFDLLLRGGVYYWQATADNVPVSFITFPGGGSFSIGQTTTVKDDGYNIKFGGGLQYNFSDHFALRAQFERYNGIGNSSATGDSKVNFESVGAVIKF